MDSYWEQFKTPFLCFAGYSGVGKTTLIERLIKRFKEDAIRIGYYKHDAHRFTMDKEGKDTFRCAQAGAGIVTINDPVHFAVVANDDFKQRTVTHALEQCDCILIEGYKQSPFDKVVFLDAEGALPIPHDTPGIKALIHMGTLPEGRLKDPDIPVFHRDEIDRIYAFVKTHFFNRACPLYGAVFIGGQSKRMGGVPKFMLCYNGMPESLRLVNLLGKYGEKLFLSSRADLDMSALGPLPNCERIDDEHIGLGPVGGLATLMGRFPDKAWLVVACDMPFLREENLSAIVRERDPLRYGTCYIQKGHLGFEPMCAIYEPKFILPLYEAMSRRELSLSRIISELPFKYVKVREDDRFNFMNVNT
ncbi:MAG: molybdopterin-guanine dinucleotide biosynthesis protein B, partial [Nitrospinae bacterium]|nr:molybdopterin-guanine dinucleotide biosynthesis protein B [Nitrospinota bacterium]